MGYVVNIYKQNFLQRFDIDEAVPFYSPKDFKGLVFEENSFENSSGANIKYFYFYYPKYQEDKIVLFCPGIGPGHVSYLAEIEWLCKNGYKVLTLDYAGCGYSGGERLPSTNGPTKDIVELLDKLQLKEEIVVVGHSLGGYTAYNVINLKPEIHKAVIISGYVDIASEMQTFMKFRFLANKVKRFEKKLDPVYGNIDNWKYLKNTTDEILIIHSPDDQMVGYKYSTQKVAKLGNPHIHVHIVENRKHNPNYSDEALAFMNNSMYGYNKLLAENKGITLEERKQYFLDKPIEKLTAQDPAIIKLVCDFIK